jgi:protein LSM14
MPYGAPPGWYPGPGQGFPPGPFPPSPYGYPPGPPGQFPQQPQQPPKPAPIGPGANKQAPSASQSTEKPAAPKNAQKPVDAASTSSQKASTTVASKSPAVDVQAAASQSSSSVPVTRGVAHPAANATGRIIPAVPLQSPALAKAPLQAATANTTSVSSAAPVDPADKLSAATQAATAAVAAAMAKMPPAGQSNGNAVDNLTRKVNEMRTGDHVRAPRQPGGGSGFAKRGGRGGARNAPPGTEVPKTDFDFETANAKFNKQELVKEAIAGSPLTENPPAASTLDPELPVSGYNKSTSFFDNISSESKDRMEAGNSKPGGREWRGEEQKKNVETFGQGSVDNGYRGKFREGRGRGRGRGGYRGRGYSGNGQPRGGSAYRGRDAQTLA